MKMYKYQGRMISVTEGANLAGVSPKTMYARLQKNGNDMELAVLGGENEPMELPVYELSAETAAQEQIMEILSGQDKPAPEPEYEPDNEDAARMPEKTSELGKLNALINALGLVDDIEMCDEVLRTQLKEKHTELIGMRSVMYGHLVDWEAVANAGKISG